MVRILQKKLAFVKNSTLTLQWFGRATHLRLLYFGIEAEALLKKNLNKFGSIKDIILYLCRDVAVSTANHTHRRQDFGFAADAHLRAL